MRPYAARPIAFAGVQSVQGWDVKHYRIALTGDAFDPPRMAGGVALALEALPEPAHTPERAGLAFIIAHQGRGMDYVVLAWWDRENELPLRVWVREQRSSSNWRAAQGAESVCVWDLQVIAHERDAYVTTVLSTSVESGRRAYLENTLSTTVRA